MNEAVDVCINMFQSFVVTWYLEHCLHTSKDRKQVYFIGVIVTFAYLTIQNQITIFEGSGILIFLMLSFMYSCIFLDGNVMYKAVCNILLIMVLAFQSVMAGSIVGIVVSKNFISIIQTHDVYYYATVAVGQVLLVLILWIIIKLFENFRNMSNYGYVLLSLCIPIATILICSGILKIGESEENAVFYVPVTIIGLVCVNIVVIFLLIVQQKQCRRQADASIQMNLIQHKKEDVEEIKKVHSDMMKIYHEVNKAMEMTQYLIENGQDDRAKKYIQEFRANSQRVQHTIYTENVIVNHLLNRKLDVCTEKGISTKCVVLGDLDGISDYDLHILLENLINNAIEAAQKTDKGIISIEIYGEQDGIGIEITNSVQEDVLEHNRALQTTKSNKAFHGYGMQNIKDIVYKYHGKITYQNKMTGMFTCKVVLLKNEAAD